MKALKEQLHRFFFGKSRKEKVFELLFSLSMILKGIDGIIELLGGIAFAAVNKEKMLQWFYDFLMNEKAFQISNETILKWVTAFSDALQTNVRVFITIILIGNGIIKIVMAIALLMRKYAAFPWSLFFLVLLFVYQIVQTIQSPSWFLYFFDAFDFAIILVIWKQYLLLKKDNKI
jgi:uncharacterized membrane protein